MSFGSRFTPPIMSREFVAAEIDKLAERTGIVHVDRVDWMIDSIIEGDQSGIPRDRALARDERLRTTLTELGMTDPGQALAAIMLCAPLARSRARDAATAVELQRPNQLSVVMDRRSCEVAKSRHREVFEIGGEPALPLPGCDVWHCRCIFIGHYRKRTT